MKNCRVGIGGGAAAAALLCFASLKALVLASPADRDIAEGASFGPVPPTSLAEMARLRLVVIVVVAELGVRRITSRTPQRRRRLLLLLLRLLLLLLARLRRLWYLQSSILQKQILCPIQPITGDLFGTQTHILFLGVTKGKRERETLSAISPWREGCRAAEER